MSWNNELDTHIYTHTHIIHLKGPFQNAYSSKQTNKQKRCGSVWKEKIWSKDMFFEWHVPAKDMNATVPFSSYFHRQTMEKPTQAHSKYVPLNTFLQHHYCVPYCTFCGSFKVKRPVSGAKTWVQYVTLARFCYVDIGTYCCVCITLLQVRIAVDHNLNIWWVSLKFNALSCWKYPLHQTQP